MGDGRDILQMVYIQQAIPFGYNLSEALDHAGSAMNLRQIRALHAILVTGSISRAAEMLAITQPAVSKTLRGLEEEIGYSLFRRTRGQLEPTPEAAFLFDEIDHTLQGLDRLEDLVRRAPRGLPERLVIASLPGPSNFFIPELLKEFFGEQASPKITLTSRTTPVIRELASTQQIDIGVLVDPPESPNYEIEKTPVEYVCAFPAGDRLSEKARVTPRDLDGRPLITPISDHIVFRQLREAFAEAGAAFNPMHEIPFYLPGLGLVLSGFGVAIVDTVTAWTYERTIKARGLAFRPFVPTFYDRLAVISPILRPLSHTAIGFRDTLANGFRRISSVYSDRAAR